MKTMTSTPDGMADAVAAVEPVTEEVTQTPVLITEQQVVFSTAAAAPVRPSLRRLNVCLWMIQVFWSPSPTSSASPTTPSSWGSGF
jgi:hypothetical protein